MKNGKIKFVIMRFCMAVLVCFMGIAAVRFLTRQLLVEKLHMDNAFTRLVFWGNPGLGVVVGAENQMEQEEKLPAIDWQERYPFSGENALPSHEEKEGNGILVKIEAMKSSLEKYTNNYLPGYQQYVEAANQYEALIGWNLLVYNEYNGVVKLDDNYLVGFMGRQDVSENIEALAELYEFCQESGTAFLYVQAPGKISGQQDIEIAGKMDFSNSNMDQLIEGLADSGVPYLDIRQNLEEEKQDYHGFFYNTDHHWRAETGLWVAGILAETLNNEYGMDIKEECLLPENFTEIIYEDWFLGSQGKKVTLSQTNPDNFCLIYPNFETSLHFCISSIDLDIVGDFAITYDMSQVETMDYYNLNPYAAYAYGTRPLITIHNENIKNGKKILFVKDSFANVVVPFLALGTEDTEMLDLRVFNGSLEAYIQQSCPDIVIVLYYPDSIQKVTDDAHLSTFDFR